MPSTPAPFFPAKSRRSLANPSRACLQTLRVEVRWAHKEQELHACQVLFISRANGKNYAKALDAVRRDSVLTVGETPDFLEAGGAVTFSFQQELLQFEINLNAVDVARLKISSRLLSLARRVVNNAAGSKS